MTVHQLRHRRTPQPHNGRAIGRFWFTYLSLLAYVAWKIFT